MFNKVAKRIIHRRRGSALASTLVLLTLASIASLLMAETVRDQGRLNQRRRELSRAFYAAEGGVALVQHWGNYPSEFTPNPNLFTRIDPATLPPTEGGSLIDINADPELLFPQLSAMISGDSYYIHEDTLEKMGIGEFESNYDYGVGQIDEIELLPPAVDDPIACFFKVHSTGLSPNGIERRVLSYMNVNPIISISVPAGLISQNMASVSGNARVHWGEAWSKNNIDMLGKSQMDYVIPGDADYDPRAIFRTEAQIDFPATWKWGAGKDLDDPTATYPGLAPASGDYAAAFEQFVAPGTLEWPTFDYQAFKDMAITHGRYYSTDASGNVYRDGIEDADHKVDFLDEFGVADRSSAPYDLFFIDTIDGNTPAADGSNLATVSASGTSLGLKGIAYIGANFDAGGVGSPPSLVAEDPDEVNQLLDKIFIDGVLYSAGTVEMGGNAGVYGSVIADSGFAGGGTPDIYYNHNLADGLILDNGNIGSVFTVSLTTNY